MRKIMLAATVLVALLAQPVGMASSQQPVLGRAYEQPGPHQVTKVLGGPDHTLYYPSDIASGTARHPVVIWGNGTGVTPEPYDALLRHWASWGFVVAAANTTQSGSGSEMLAGAKFLIAEDGRPGSVFAGRIDTTKIGAAGHSQGGGGAIAAGDDELVDVTVPIMPGPQGSVPQLKGPSFFIAGQRDAIVPSPYVRGRYAWAKQHPAVFAELRGADHFFPGETRTRAIGATTAWLRYWLSGDQNAKSVFFGDSPELSTDKEAWSSFDRNAKADTTR